MTRASLQITLAVVGSVILTAVLLTLPEYSHRTRDGRSPDSDDSPKYHDSSLGPIGSTSDEEMLDPSLEPARVLASRSLDTAPDSAPDSALGAPGSAGWIEMIVVDADYREILDKVSFECASPTRYAGIYAGGSLRVKLSVGTYKGTLSSEGYERLDLSTFEILAGEVTSLGQIEMYPGDGSVRGVISTAIPLDEIFRVDLYGTGRRRCQHCGSKNSEHAESLCQFCGYAWKRSTHRVRCGDTFLFPCLASGSYALQVYDEQSRFVGKSVEFTLISHEHAFQSIDMERSAEVTLELHNEGGGVFQPEIEQIGGIVYSISNKRDRVGRVVIVFGDEYLQTDEFLEEIAEDAIEESLEEPIADRPRRDSDTLVHRHRFPSLPPQTLSATANSDSRHTISGLPIGALTLEASIGPFKSERVSLDLRSGVQAEIVSVVLRRSRGMEEQPLFGRWLVETAPGDVIVFAR